MQQLPIFVSIIDCWFAKHCKTSKYQTSEPRDFQNIQKNDYIINM